ncbi:hypothetical protein [Streptomyces albus]|uniref:hypothetical protein n=1 Tax=Streptomyces albus TaxID=1888 RepID=UPI0024E110EA|nr:hypothetical protein [Streptomyces albus]GHJ21686.1 hypothetical protein TPA0909_33000 [Streptomyces albus]
MSTSSQNTDPLTPDREQEIRDRVDAAVDAEFVAHAREDVPQLLAEVDRLRLLVRMYKEHADHYRAYEQDARAETDRLRARVAELERPAVEANRAEIRQSYRGLAAQAREAGDYEGAFEVDCRLREREEQWKREDAGATRTERSYWVAIAEALNAAVAAGLPIGIDLDGTITDRNAWSVVWDRDRKRWAVAGYDDEGGAR